MKLFFIGADHEVTGSCHVLEINGHFIMMDYGMEQGKDIYENSSLPVQPSMIDAMLLSHAHIDHSGMIPKFVKDGFKGPIYCTNATKDLCSVMLLDSAHIQESEAEWKSRKAIRAGRPKVEPPYTTEDVARCMKQFAAVAYGQEFQVCDGMRVRYEDGGHILGSAIMHITMTEGGIEKVLSFSGDLGNSHVPLLKDPAPLEKSDYVLIESTYGDRLHEKVDDQIPVIASIMNETFSRGGNLVIPCFAVGRTQEMLYFLREIRMRNLVSCPNGYSVYVDSPLAVEATDIFEKNVFGYYDADAMKLIDKGEHPLRFEGLKLATTVDESKMINSDTQCKVILSASGMCDGGRIRHHLKHNLWRQDSTVCFSGYQGEGTLGRKLLDGANSVNLFGETIAVSARIVQLQDISAHADRDGLASWLNGAADKPDRVFVVHGEDLVTESFARFLNDHFGYNSLAPFSGSVFNLMTDEWIAETTGERIEKGTEIHTTGPGEEEKKDLTTFGQLMAAGQELLTVIQNSGSLRSREMKKFLKELKAFIRRWQN